MFVRVNKTDNVPDDNGGKGGWWTVQPGVPDEGRPGRKAKAKRPRAEDGEDGDGQGEDVVAGWSRGEIGTMSGRDGVLGADGYGG